MNELSSLGLILLFALLAGHLVKYVKIPEVTGYILAGVVVGPSVLGWVSHENLSALSVLSEVALGLILFSIGSVFEFSRVKAVGEGVLRVTVIESALAAACVTGGMLLLGQRWQVAFLLGAIAVETAAASTLMVIREVDSEGPLTETLTGIIGVNNILCLIAFAIAGATIDLAASFTDGDLLVTLYRSIYPLVWQMVGSVALGFLVGLLLAAWAPRVIEHGELLILLIGCVLLCVGTALLLELSTLIASMAVGATMVNLSAQTKRMFRALSRTDPPFYAIFFVIAGADLNLGLLKTIGLLGVVYVIARGSGKFFGARIGARKVGLPKYVQSNLGFALFSQAGLAIGLTLIINRRFPDFGPQVTTIVLASVVIYEMIGPVSAKLALLRSGETKSKFEPSQDVTLDPA